MTGSELIFRVLLHYDHDLVQPKGYRPDASMEIPDVGTQLAMVQWVLIFFEQQWLRWRLHFVSKDIDIGASASNVGTLYVGRESAWGCHSIVLH